MGDEDWTKRRFPSASCAGGVEILTLREQEALNNLMTIKTRVRELKQALGETSDASTDQGRDSIERELNCLKQEWNRWEEERKEAARERMTLLGHEEV